MEKTELPAVLLDILVCPVCKGKLNYEKKGELLCGKCGSYQIDSGIPVLLPKG